MLSGLLSEPGWDCTFCIRLRAITNNFGGWVLKFGLYGNRDMQDRAQHYAPFTFKIKLPKLRKSRNILKRDEIGRIIYAQPPVE